MTHEEKLNVALQQVKALKKKAKKYLRDSRMVEDTVYKLMNDGRADDPEKLEVGNWYRFEGTKFLDDGEENKALSFLCDDGYSFGFDTKGDWYDISYNPITEYGIKTSRLATPQEVGEALVKEAKRRGLLQPSIRFKSPNGEDYGYLYNGGQVSLNEEMNILHFRESFGVYTHLFNDGKWAEVIEEDKFAELKEAHRIGDVCSFTDYEPSEDYVVGKLVAMDSRSEFQYESPIGSHRYAKPLTKQEAIDLLFGKEVSDEE